MIKTYILVIKKYSVFLKVHISNILSLKMKNNY